MYYNEVGRAMRLTMPVTWLLLVWVGIAQAGTVHIYVSPAGSDSNTGLAIGHPLKTLHMALARLDDTDIKGNDIYVEMLKGYYDLSSTLHFTKSYTGSVNFRPYKNQEVHVTGGKRISSSHFHKVTDNNILKMLPDPSHGKVYQVHLPDVGITDYGQMSRFGFHYTKTSWLEIFINGIPGQLAQYPNEGYMDVTAVNGTTISHNYRKDSKWTQEKDPWALGYWQWSWADDAIQITSIDAHSHSLTLARLPGFGLRTGSFSNPHAGYSHQGGYFRVINMLTELDQPGEYYTDRTTGILYVWPNTPTGSLTSSDVIYASMIGDCVKIEQHVSNIHFEGFTLEACRRYGFSITNGRDISFMNMEIRNTGAYGITCVRDCRSVSVSRSEIHHTCGGINMYGGDRKTLTPSGIIIEDNHIWQYARVGASGYNAVTSFGVGTATRYNHIHDGQYIGIWWGGNDHLIEYNHVHHLCVNASDCGGIHAGRDWSMRGNVIRNNHVHHVLRLVPGSDVRGIMLDDEYSSVTIAHNVFYDNEVHVNIGGGRDNIVKYNVFYKATDSSVKVDGRGLGQSISYFSQLEKHLQKMPYKSPLWTSKYPKLAHMTKPEEPAGNQVYNNVFYNDHGISSVKYMTRNIDKPEFYDVHTNHKAYSPSEFWSADEADFRLQCTASEWANGIGFPQPLDMNHVGPRYQTGPAYMQKPRPTYTSQNHVACAATKAPATKTPKTPYYSDGSGPNTVYPNITTGCWLMTSSCPDHPPSQGTHRDTFGEQHVQAGVNQENCLKRAADQWRYCGSPSKGTVTAVFGPTGAMTIAGMHCYFAGYGCPSHHIFHTGRLDVDSHGEHHGGLSSEKTCLQRAPDQWHYCGSDPDQPISSIYGPTGATRHAGGGCWIKIANCPKDSKLKGFFYDAWGATNLDTDHDRTECLERAGYFWQHCGSHTDSPVTVYFRPDAASKTVPH